MGTLLKCRKCRHELVRGSASSNVIISAHGERKESVPEVDCSEVNQDSLWFLDESTTPWISNAIEKCGWTKGKLNCPNCEARVGSFDFVSQLKCACGSFVLPAVHIVKSKADMCLLDPLAALKM